MLDKLTSECYTLNNDEVKKAMKPLKNSFLGAFSLEAPAQEQKKAKKPLFKQ